VRPICCYDCSHPSPSIASRFHPLPKTASSRWRLLAPPTVRSAELVAQRTACRFTGTSMCDGGGPRNGYGRRYILGRCNELSHILIPPPLRTRKERAERYVINTSVLGVLSIQRRRTRKGLGWMCCPAYSTIAASSRTPG
jgi:hypothetical protein